MKPAPPVTSARDGLAMSEAPEGAQLCWRREDLSTWARMRGPVARRGLFALAPSRCVPPLGPALSPARGRGRADAGLADGAVDVAEAGVGPHAAHGQVFGPDRRHLVGRQGALGGLDVDVVEAGRVAGEDRALDQPVGGAERREAVPLLHVL